MQGEYQSPESRTAAIEGSYSYTESAGRSLGRSQRANAAPSEFFRYRMVKRCCDIFLVLLSMPITLPILGMISAVGMFSDPRATCPSLPQIRGNEVVFVLLSVPRMVLA